MNKQENTIEKVCSFYINEWHLTTMILPYINKELNNKTQIITILQNGIKENIEEILKRMNLKENDTKQILNVNWTSTEVIKYTNLQEQILNTKNKKIIILVNGKREYIENANKNINKILRNNKNKTKISIINCFEITEFDNISEITKKHEYILNTSGIQRISDVFEKEEPQEA